MTAETDAPETPAPGVSPQVKAERNRVMEGLNLVINDCLREWESVGHAVAEALVQGFCKELVKLSRFVRTGQPLQAFAESRKPRSPGASGEADELPLADEVKEQEEI